MMNEQLKALFEQASLEQALREVSQQVFIELMITGTCTMKMMLNHETNEIKFEISSPFKGCECGEIEAVRKKGMK